MLHERLLERDTWLIRTLFGGIEGDPHEENFDDVAAEHESHPNLPVEIPLFFSTHGPSLGVEDTEIRQESQTPKTRLHDHLEHTDTMKEELAEEMARAMTKDSSNTPLSQPAMQALVNSNYFELFFGIAVVANSLLIGAEVEYLATFPSSFPPFLTSFPSFLFFLPSFLPFLPSFLSFLPFLTSPNNLCSAWIPFLSQEYLV